MKCKEEKERVKRFVVGLGKTSLERIRKREFEFRAARSHPPIKPLHIFIRNDNPRLCHEVDGYSVVNLKLNNKAIKLLEHGLVYKVKTKHYEFFLHYYADEDENVIDMEELK